MMRASFHRSARLAPDLPQGHTIFEQKIMGKNNTPKPAAAAAKKPAKVTAKKKAVVTPTPVVVEPPVEAVAPLKRVRKTAAPKITKTTAKAPRAPKTLKLVEPTPSPTYTHADVSLRAYFIAQRRQSLGIHGDPHTDWIEAERQLAEEFAISQPKPKAAKSAKTPKPKKA